MRQMEILAPVGGQQQLIAAVRCGANAVYLGTQGFNARRNAENFDADALREAVRYCHARDVKVYVLSLIHISDCAPARHGGHRRARRGAQRDHGRGQSGAVRVQALCS